MLSTIVQAYLIIGLIFGCLVHLANGTFPSWLHIPMWAIGWPYFFYRGFIRKS